MYLEKRRGFAVEQRLEIPPATAPQEIQDHEPAEEETGDEDHEPYDAQQKIERLQNGRPFVCPLLGVSRQDPARVGTAGFEPATTRPPAECAT